MGRSFYICATLPFYQCLNVVTPFTLFKWNIKFQRTDWAKSFWKILHIPVGFRFHENRRIFHEITLILILNLHSKQCHQFYRPPKIRSTYLCCYWGLTKSSFTVAEKFGPAWAKIDQDPKYQPEEIYTVVNEVRSDGNGIDGDSSFKGISTLKVFVLWKPFSQLLMIEKWIYL